MRADVEAKAAITKLKGKFCNSAEALIHGDLHTGSFMVNSIAACRRCKPSAACPAAAADDDDDPDPDPDPDPHCIALFFLSCFLCILSVWLLFVVLTHQVTAETTKVIDPEFAYVGPMAFDIGKITTYFIMGYLASDGLETNPGSSGSRAKQRAWLLSSVVEIWETFSSK
jgi:5-methylthioribose kinase